ncbi:MAG: hypothetical protein LBJ46_03320 [Planctomycetota bacterium]|jgi:hypothetical protein|nr:hypothetical protein [Planctomycetota bacterium]
MSEDFAKPSLERFKVFGNILKLTARFDPRYQPRVGMEMMNILSSLAEECSTPEVVLDMSDAASMPSMMIGFLHEAKELTNKAGKQLRIRIKTDTYNRLQPLGVWGDFSPTPKAGGDSGSLELVPAAPPAD